MSLLQVDSAQWNAAAIHSGELNPFVLHAFLKALEDSESAVANTGWVPHHLVVREGDGDDIVGCCPIYLKVTLFLTAWRLLCPRQVTSAYAKSSMLCCHDEYSWSLSGVLDWQGHSYGEYVFDHSWAGMARQLGQRYCESPPL